MAAVTVNSRYEALPGIEILSITTAADADTYESKLAVINGAMFMPHRDNAAADSWGVTISGRTATIQLIGTTVVTGTLFLWGTE